VVWGILPSLSDYLIGRIDNVPLPPAGVLPLSNRRRGASRAQVSAADANPRLSGGLLPLPLRSVQNGHNGGPSNTCTCLVYPVLNPLLGGYSWISPEAFHLPLPMHAT